MLYLCVQLYTSSYVNIIFDCFMYGLTQYNVSNHIKMMHMLDPTCSYLVKLEYFNLRTAGMHYNFALFYIYVYTYSLQGYFII